jgi:hypothetical protein
MKLTPEQKQKRWEEWKRGARKSGMSEVEILEIEEWLKTFNAKVAAAVKRWKCPKCGAPLRARADLFGREGVNVACSATTFDDPRDVPPGNEVHFLVGFEDADELRMMRAS